MGAGGGKFLQSQGWSGVVLFISIALILAMGTAVFLLLDKKILSAPVFTSHYKNQH